MANIITGVRIMLSAALLLCPALSPAFYALYLAAGVSDMIDGAVARKTNTVSRLGAKLDTFADLGFVAVCLIKLLPALEMPDWLSIWIAGIAIIKLTNIALGYIGQKEFVAVHSVMNKAAGGALFLFPLTLAFAGWKSIAIAFCLAATAAAIQEGYLICAANRAQRG